MINRTNVNLKYCSKYCFLLFILMLSFKSLIFSQKVKFSDLDFEYTIKKDSNNLSYIDSITFYATIKYKKIEDVKDEINYIQWDFGTINDSITFLKSWIDIRAKGDSLTIIPYESKYCICEINKYKIIYKTYIGDLKQSNILYIYFNVEYNIKYHMKYHNKKPKYIGNIREKEVNKIYNNTKQSKFTYYR